eukprot:3145104-Prymnesium_polylepis.3
MNQGAGWASYRLNLIDDALEVLIAVAELDQRSAKWDDDLIHLPLGDGRGRVDAQAPCVEPAQA